MSIKKSLNKIKNRISATASKKRKSKKTVKILSIDGGGMRGIIPTMVMDKIERLTQKPVCELFDVVAGTSTGGILALGITMPGTPPGQPRFRSRDWIAMYENEGPKIFNKSLWEQIRSMGSIIDRTYRAEGLEEVLADYFQDTRLKDALTNVLITSYEMQYQNPCFFKSHYARKRPEFDFFMRDIARATSAAPTYFPPALLEVQNREQPFALIDGGVVANNPAMCAYAEAKSLYPDAEEFIVVSLGTGAMVRSYTHEQIKKWGLASWIQPMFDLWFQGANLTVEYQLKQFLPPKANGDKRYFRFQTALTKQTEYMDDTSPTNMKQLKTLCKENILRHRKKEIKALCERLVKE